MKIARRYLLLQRIVWVQSLLCALLALYVLFSRKKSYPLTVTVNESTPIDLSFLDGITNRIYNTTQHTSPPTPVVGGEGVAPVLRTRLPFRFDRFCIVDGVPCVAVGSRVLREGDTINGRKVESISPMGVIVDGDFYEYYTGVKET